jgi:hypothetical protein
VVIAKDTGTSIFNTGVLLVKNSEWSRDFFADVLRMGADRGTRHHGRASARFCSSALLR